jgi:hypothetical protein
VNFHWAFLFHGMKKWNGKPVDKLLIDNHFGLGDQIQYWRYVKVALGLALDVWVRCDEEIIPLFKYKWPITLVGKEESLRDVLEWQNHVVDMIDLPHLLDHENSGEKYLTPNQRYLDESEGVLEKFSGKKVGVCWCGNPANPRDDDRSCSPKFFESLDKKGVKLFSLQKHIEPPSFVRDLRPFMTDLNQTAHLIMGLDLIVTVDTCIAHLAGALGKQVWMLLAEPHDARWPQVGSVSNLYNSMRIFRKKEGWNKLLEEVSAEI